MYPHSLHRHQALCLLMLASLVAALCFPSSLQAAPPGKQAPPEGPDNNKTTQTIAAQQGMELQDEVQRLWLAIESAHSAGDTPSMAALAAQLPSSQWIAAARLLREILPQEERPAIVPTGPISAEDEERHALEAAAHRATLEQAEAASRVAVLAPDLDAEKLATPAGAGNRQGGEAILTVGDSCTYATLQTAIDAAVSGDTIRVQGRTWTGTAATANINGKSLSIYGGYNSTCTVQGTTKTVMNAAGTADSVFEIFGGAGPLTVSIDNFEIKGGEDDSNDGGGIEIDNQYTVTLNRTTVHDNRSDNGGAVHMGTGTALNIQNTSLLYLNSALTGNGGGISCTGGSVTVSGDSYVGFWLLTSLGNTAAGNGGGIYLDDCGLILNGNSAAGARVIYNSADNGGGIYATNNAYVGVTGGNAAVDANQILSTTGKGGGLYLAGGSDLYVDNGQVNGNTADETGAGIYATDVGTYVDFDTTSAYFCNTPRCAQLSDNVNTGLYGGGISLEFGATLDMESVYVEGNQTAYMGSAIYARREGTSVALDSVMVTGNHAGNDQVLRLFDQATAAVQSSTFAGNTGHSNATFGVEETTRLDGDGLVVWGNDGSALVAGAGNATLDGSILQAAFPGSNNLVADPQFMDAAGGNYHLSHTSPAVDHCDSGFARDIDFEARPIDVPGIGGGVGLYDAGADEASAFIGLNGATCSYPTIVDAITAAASGDTIYISPGVYPERLGLITDDLTFTAANNGCTAEAAGGVTIDANDAAATWGGLAEIASGKSVMFKNLTLTDGTAQFGGILYADASSQVLLDNTDLSLGSASTVGGGVRLILNATVDLINGSRIIQSTATGTGDGGGVAIYQATLSLFGDSLIGDYLQGNISADRGGGVYMDGGLLQMFDNSRVRSNVAATDGGGICAFAGASVSIDSALVNDNQALAGDGGGIFLDNSHLSADNTRFSFNQAGDDGGAIAAINGSGVTVLSSMPEPTRSEGNDPAAPPELAEPCDPSGLPANIYCSTLHNNSAGDHGGALYFEGESTGAIDRVALMANTAQTGSALELYDSTGTLRHSRVSGNTATGINNSTVHVYDVGGTGPTSTFDALHNTFAGNTYTAVYYAAGTHGAFDNNVVWGNGHPGVITPNAMAACNDTQGDALAGPGNISQDPDFIATLRGDYHLAPGSPAVDRCASGGSPDLDNVSRPKGAAYDMGTFELWCANGITDIDGSGAVDIIDIQLVASDWNDPTYLPSHDVDCDGDVDVDDIIAVAGDWMP